MGIITSVVSDVVVYVGKVSNIVNVVVVVAVEEGAHDTKRNVTDIRRKTKNFVPTTFISTFFIFDRSHSK